MNDLKNVGNGGISEGKPVEYKYSEYLQAAIPQALKQANLKLQDIEMIELNEAFASQSLAVMQELGIDPSIVNPNGGAIALGHPLGCSGAKLTIQLIHEMQRQGKKRGMVSACIGGGQGIASIIELI